MSFEFDALGWTTLITAVGFTFAANYAGALTMYFSMKWYRWLRKPAFVPSAQHVGYFFAIAWFLISLASALALYLAIVQNQVSSIWYQLGISAYWATLFFGIVWAGVFFAAHSLGAALLVLLIELLLAILTTICFFFVWSVAGFLLLPLDIWLFYELMLCTWLFYLNRGRKMVIAAAPARKV